MSLKKKKISAVQQDVYPAVISCKCPAFKGIRATTLWTCRTQKFTKRAEAPCAPLYSFEDSSHRLSELYPSIISVLHGGQFYARSAVNSEHIPDHRGPHIVDRMCSDRAWLVAGGSWGRSQSRQRRQTAYLGPFAHAASIRSSAA